MKLKSLKRTGIVLLCFFLLTGAAGCQDSDSTAEEGKNTNNLSGQNRQGRGMETALTEEELAAYQAADAIEIEALEVKTDWEDRGEILLDNEKGTISITEGGVYTLSGTLSDGMVQVDTKEEVKLILKEASITCSDNPAIYVKNARSCYIETAEGTQNTLADGSEYETETEEKRKAALFSNDRLVLSGEGTLLVNGNYSHAVCSDDEVYVESGTYEFTAVKDGIHTDNWIYIADGTLDITATDDGLQSEGPITLDGGNITIAADGKGITAYGDLTVNKGNIVISKCEEGLESKNDLYVNDGNVEITGTDDGLNARTSVTINGGILCADVTAGDAIDSNGSLTVSGGLVLAFGAAAPEGGLDCDQNQIIIERGTLVAVGGTNSAPSETESTQMSILLGSAAKGDVIGIKDAEGNTVFAIEAPKDYSNLILSLETLGADKDYTVYTGGTIAGEEMYGYYGNGTYEGGTKSIDFTTDSMVIRAGGTTGTMGGPGGKRTGGGMPSGEERPEFPSDGEMPSDTQDPEA